MRILAVIAAAFVSLSAANVASAEIRTEAISYQDGDANLTRHIYRDDSISGKRPGLLEFDAAAFRRDFPGPCKGFG